MSRRSIFFATGMAAWLARDGYWLPNACWTGSVTVFVVAMTVIKTIIGICVVRSLATWISFVKNCHVDTLIFVVASLVVIIETACTVYGGCV